MGASGAISVRFSETGSVGLARLRYAADAEPRSPEEIEGSSWIPHADSPVPSA
jgi:hypothetical protein